VPGVEHEIISSPSKERGVSCVFAWGLIKKSGVDRSTTQGRLGKHMDDTTCCSIPDWELNPRLLDSESDHKPLECILNA